MLNTSATRRLASYKKQAADWLVKQPSYLHYHNWRAHRKPVVRSNGGTWQSLADMKCFASPSDRKYYCDTWPDGIRDLGDASDVVDLRHTGWYADNDQNELVKGRVLQMPARNGRTYYFPAIYRTDSEGVTLWPLDGYEEKEDAARTADSYAEHDAEECREYDAKDRAEFESGELKERIVEIRGELRSLIREMKAHRTVSDSPTICSVLRGEIAQLRRESHKAYKRIQALADNEWLAVE